jgi:hypothetical protein
MRGEESGRHGVGGGRGNRANHTQKLFSDLEENFYLKKEKNSIDLKCVVCILVKIINAT